TTITTPCVGALAPAPALADAAADCDGRGGQCVCPPGRFGQDCSHFGTGGCDGFTCMNGGVCVQYSLSNPPSCACPNGFAARRTPHAARRRVCQARDIACGC